MRHRSPRTPPAPTSRTLPGRLLKRLAPLGAVAGALVAVVVAVTDEPAPPAPEVVAAEQDTRAFLDERAAAHLRRLRASR